MTRQWMTQQWVYGHILILAFPYHTYDESMFSESAIQYFTLYYAG